MRAGLPGIWLLTGLMLAHPALAKPPATGEATNAQAVESAAATPPTRSGREIYQRFREGLADPNCEAGSSSSRWSKHFAAAPGRLAARNDDLLPLFGYVVDALREASLPTEYALIPFVESGYKPGARSPSGPAGLWQMITLTARNHRVPISAGYDGRLSPVDSTKAAVRYLKTLHGMFAGDWRLAVMAYNAGEYRILGALKRSGQKARSANPEQLQGLPDISHAYVRKLHALSCLMEQADDREEWLRALDRPVPRLASVSVPDNVADIAGWAARNGQDAAQLQRLNPVFANGRIGRIAGGRAPLLAIAPSAVGGVQTSMQSDTTGRSAAMSSRHRRTVSDPASVETAPTSTRHHTVAKGESPWTIARLHRIGVADLMQRNGLANSSVLKPGMVLQVDLPPPGSDAARVAE